MTLRDNIFSNRIRPSVQIDGDFKVALDNIFFEESYVAIKKGDVNYSVYFDMIEFDEKQSPTKTKSIVYTPKTDFVVKTIEDLIAKLNHELLKFLLEKNVIIARNTIDFIILKDGRVHIDPITTDFEDVPEKKNIAVAWRFSEGWRKVLGFQEDTPSTDSRKISAYYVDHVKWFSLKSIFPPKLPKSIPSTIYVYSDIVTPSFIGTHSANLLDVIVLKNDWFSKNKAFTPYKNVSKTSIDEINISLRDENGNPISFSKNVSVTVVLHFKKM